MKNTFFLAIVALFMGISASAQSTVDSIAAKYQLQPMPAPLTIEKTFPVLGTYQLTTPTTDVAVNANVSTSVNATAPTTSTTTTTTTTATDAAVEAAPASIVITLDSASKGIVWVDGLPEGRFKAYLKKSPTSYRIISQKTNLGKQIPEGTLIYDEATNTLNIAFGKPYDEADPAGIFTANAATATVDATTTATTAKSKTKAKSKVTFYTASKAITAPTEGTTSTTAVKQNDQQ